MIVITIKKRTSSEESEWECEYCKKLNKITNYKCQHCRQVNKVIFELLENNLIKN